MDYDSRSTTDDNNNNNAIYISLECIDALQICRNAVCDVNGKANKPKYIIIVANCVTVCPSRHCCYVMTTSKAVPLHHLLEYQLCD